MVSLCDQPLRQLGNPGASGSLFFLTSDDKFIIKTVEGGESKFLLQLLPGYYMNLVQNKRTLLPKFFAFFAYKGGSIKREIRFVVMNNILPTRFDYFQRFDLKGSEFKRWASDKEKAKKDPCFKDIDFNRFHVDGVRLSVDDHANLKKTLERDVMVLESFRIMDYSLLLGVHRIGIDADRDMHTQKLMRRKSGKFMTFSEQISQEPEQDHVVEGAFGRTTGFDGVQDATDGGVRAKLRETAEDGTTREVDVLVFVGVIDILQSFGLRKKLEHKWKSMLHDGSKVSVHKPKFYATRFERYMTEKVFQPDPRSVSKTVPASVASPRAQARGRHAAGGGRAGQGQTPVSTDRANKGLPRSSLATMQAAPSPYFRRGVSPNGLRPSSAEWADEDGAANGEGAADTAARLAQTEQFETIASRGGEDARGAGAAPRPSIQLSGLGSATDTDAPLPRPSLQLSGLEHVGGTETDELFLAVLSPDQVCSANCTIALPRCACVRW